MTESLPEHLLESFSEFVDVHVGLHFPRERWPDLARGAGVVAAELGFDSVEACVQALMQVPVDTGRIEVLARHLTIGETYFFRDPNELDLLRDHVLPGLIASRRSGERRLRLWSVACSTGEEAYTLAIVVRNALPDIQDWNVTILATDINPQAVRKAEAGLFSEWSFRSVPRWVKASHFRKLSSGLYQVVPETRDMVKFACLNLVDDVYPSLANDTNAMDAILCRNVLMYFSPQQSGRVLAKLCHSLVDQGWLVVSPGDAFSVTVPDLESVCFAGTTVFRKQGIAASSPAERRLDAGGQPGTTALEGCGPESVRAGELDEATRCYSAGHYAEASERLSSCVERGGASPEVLRLLAQSFANEGKLADALAWNERELVSNKADPESHYLRASILLEQGNTGGATRSFRDALCLEPGFVPAHIALGNLSRREGDVESARRHYRNALRALAECQRDQPVRGADGMTAGRLADTIASLMEMECVA